MDKTAYKVKAWCLWFCCAASRKKRFIQEGMEFLLISAMYRGYDIAIDDSFDSGVVAKRLS
jgi:hypothetical protein